MNIEEIREALAGMTLPEIAEGTGVSPRAVFNFMHDKVTPSPETLERMRAFIDGPEHHQQALARFDAALARVDAALAGARAALADGRAAMGAMAVNVTLRAGQAERDLARLRSGGL